MDPFVTSTTAAAAGVAHHHLPPSSFSTSTLPPNTTPSTPAASVDNLQLVGLFLAGLVSTVANLLVVMTVLLTPKLRSTSSSVLITSLAFADLAFTALVVPLAACGLINKRWLFSQLACSVTTALSAVFSAGSALSVAAIAMDRYLAILHCLRYSVWPRWRYLLLVLSCTWFPALLVGGVVCSHVESVSYVTSQYTCQLKAAKVPLYVWLRAVLVFLLPFVILVFAYVRVIYVARLHSRRIDVEAPRCRRRTSSDVSKRTESVSPNGAVAAGALFSIRRLSILSMPQRAEGEGRQIRISGDLELVSSSAHVIREEGGVTPHRRSCTSLKLLVLIVVFMSCCGFDTVVNIYQTLVPAPTHSRGILVTEIAQPSGSQYILSPPVLGGNRSRVRGEEGGMFSEQVEKNVMKAAFWLTVINSMLNPFLYAISSQRFRFFAARLFSKHDAGGGGMGLPGGHLFDVSIYSAFLRNLQTPVASRRGSSDSVDSSHQHFPMTTVVHTTTRRESGSSVGTETTLLESKGGSPLARHKHVHYKSRFLEVPHSITHDDSMPTTTTTTTRPQLEDSVHVGRGGEVLYRRNASISSATSICSDWSQSSCHSEGQLSISRTQRNSASPTRCPVHDDFVFSANNAARIRIVLDLV